LKMKRYEAERACWLCGRNGCADVLDKHHIFGGAFREKSEKLGLVVWLCHHDCHIFGPEAVHRNSETMQRLHEYGQKLAMDRFGWDIEDFRLEFGKNYLPTAEERAVGTHGGKMPSVPDETPDEEESVSVFGFALLPEDAALPW